MRDAMAMKPDRILFAHIPKAAGSYLTDYFEARLGVPWIQSNGRTDDGVWEDFTIDELLTKSGVERGLVSSHVLAYGWSNLVSLVPFAEKQRIIETIRTFRSQGRFAISFVRHPGD